MRYFVTGATGFIGGAITRKLRAAGHEVRALVRDPGRAGALAALGVELHGGDVREASTLRTPMQDCDGVFHVAAWYRVGEPADAARAINVEGTRNVLSTMRALGIPKGVYTSTVAVFSDTYGRMVDESYRYDGEMLTVYERTKHEAHYHVVLPMIEDGLPLVVVMPGVVYGPGDQGPMRTAIVQYLQGRLPAVPRDTYFCWAHVDDVADGHIAAMERGRVGEAYILAGPRHGFAEVLDLAQRYSKVKAPRIRPSGGTLRALARVMAWVERAVPVPVSVRAESLRAVAGVTYTASSAKARAELGFDPRPLDEGLAEWIAFEQQRLGR